jgi:hypothetical protein
MPMQRNRILIGLAFAVTQIALGSQSLVLTSTFRASSTLPNTTPYAQLGSWKIEGQADHWVNHATNVDLFALSSDASISITAANSLLLQGHNSEVNIYLPLGNTTAFRFVAQRNMTTGKYTLEFWDQETGAYSAAEATPSNFKTVDRRNHQFSIGSFYAATSPDVRIGFIRWSSGVRPLGGKPPLMVASSPGDLLDFEFDGSNKEVSGNNLSLTISAGSLSFADTAVYAPAINLGATPLTVRAGTVATIDASNSFSNSDSANLRCLWGQTKAAQWGKLDEGSVNCTATFIPPVFGTYYIRVVVQDPIGRASSRTFKIGAVATDDKDVVVVGDPKIGAILGPLVRYGANPWSWMDDRNKAAADNQIALIANGTWDDFWNVADPNGTITVTGAAYGGSGSSTIVTGAGTQFQTDFCGGVGNTTPVAETNTIWVWYPSTDYPGTTGRGWYPIVSCDSQTQLTLQFKFQHRTGTFDGLQYAIGSAAKMYGWIRGNIPGNYYDNVLALYSLYYRTGIDDYLDAARTMASRFWTGPNWDRGWIYNNSQLYGTFVVAGPARGQAPTGLVLWYLDQGTNIWTGAHHLWDTWVSQATTPTTYMGSIRERQYMLGGLALCALYDADSTYKDTTCPNALSSAINNVWKPLQLTSGAKNWPETNLLKNYMAYDGTNYVTVTDGSPNITMHGSTTFVVDDFFTDYVGNGPPLVTTNGTAVTYSGGDLFDANWIHQIPAPLWVKLNGAFYQVASINSTTSLTLISSAGIQSSPVSMIPLNRWLWFIDDPRNVDLPGNKNSDVGDSAIYKIASITDPTHAVLATPYTSGGCPRGCNKGLTTSHVPGFGDFPYMTGMSMGTLAQFVYPALVAHGDTTTAAIVKQMVRDGVAYLQASAYDPSNKSVFASTQFLNCRNGLPYDECAGTLVFNGEAINAFTQGFLLTGDSSMKDSADVLIQAMWCKPTGGWTCPFAPSGTYMPDINGNGVDGGYMINPNPASNKWLGFFFGYGFNMSSAAARVGGIAPVELRTVSVPFDLTSVENAGKVRLTILEPSGISHETICVTSPCQATVDARQGDHLMKLDYLSDLGIVISPGEISVLSVER